MSESGVMHESAPLHFAAAQAFAEAARRMHAMSYNLDTSPLADAIRETTASFARLSAASAFAEIAMGFAALAAHNVRTREAIHRQAWERRVLASLRVPCGEERAEIAAWLAATGRDPLPLP